VAELIEQKFGMTLGLTAIGKLLAKLGLTPQKPLQRAYQRDPEAIETWRRERYPAIARQAKKEHADIFLWDESEFRADAVHGKTWGLRGQTPVVQRHGQRQSISAASAVNAKGAFWFCTYEGALNAELFVTLLKTMMRYRRRPVHLVHDSLPAHKKACVREYVESTKGKLRPAEKSGCQRFVKLRNGGKDESDTESTVHKRSTGRGSEPRESGRGIGSVPAAVNPLKTLENWMRAADAGKLQEVGKHEPVASEAEL
jgi:hypothetical protein